MYRAVCVLVIMELMIFAKDSEAYCANSLKNRVHHNRTVESHVSQHRHARNIEHEPFEEQHDQQLMDLDDQRHVAYADDPHHYELTSTALDANDEFRDVRNLDTDYASLCEIVVKLVELNNEEYEYRPSIYHEVYCKYYSELSEAERKRVHPSNQTCAFPVFHCVQTSGTLFALRRRWDSNCWEPHTREYYNSCECMWPVHSLGEVEPHY